MGQVIVDPGRRSRQRTDLLKTACIRQQVDAFAHRELAATMLKGDAIGAAHLSCHRLPAV